ncbi:MAG: metallopeptidase family protein [Planctomycetes bacterium]|nr:metallopeptidase family protein [Planctomycetota bacterium]
MPDRIVLYQGSIEQAAHTADQITEEIRKTVLHEVGHHFGLEEDELEQLGYD